jgi:hypothetical protein
MDKYHDCGHRLRIHDKRKRSMKKNQIKQVVDEVLDHTYTNSEHHSSEFLTDLLALHRKYPHCYIEAWTPEDYENISQKHLTKGQCEIVSSMLYNTMDANEGTTWDKVNRLVEKTLNEYE